MRPARRGKPVAFVLKGYPRLSETFIAQEILGLERAGLEILIVSMRRPTDGKRHAVHDEISAKVHYLPEYLHEAPLRVAGAFLGRLFRSGFFRALAAFLRDLPRDLSRSRFRRFGQALVLAHELPDEIERLHAHFIHTPADVTRYASLLTGRPWSISAHAKDIWTSPDWLLRRKLGAADWAVTCTRAGQTRLNQVAPPEKQVSLIYHGLDFARFPETGAARPARDGSDPAAPVELLSVGRAVGKKGFDLVIEALARLPDDLHWRWRHIGGGDLLPGLRQQAERLDVQERVSFIGSAAQPEVLAHYRSADLFVLPCRVEADGNRDGLPNVIVEALSQNLAVVTTPVSGITELIDDGTNGWLVPENDPAALARALEAAIRNPAERARRGAAGGARVRRDFDHLKGIAALDALFAGTPGCPCQP